MADMSPLLVTAGLSVSDMRALLITAETHPFQLQDLPGPKGPYDITRMKTGFFVRLDMPGVPPNGIKIFKRSEKKMITFNATAPKKEDFPYDESERVYAGFVQLNKDPNELLVDVIAENGSFILLFPAADGHLLFMPQPRSHNSPLGEGSSSGKSIDQSQGSEKSKQDEASSEKSIDKAEGFAKYGSGETASNESAEGSVQTKQGEAHSGKVIDKAEDSAKSSSSKSSSNDFAEAWMLACIKRNVLQVEIPEPLEEESAPVETSTEQSSHEVPDIAIGSIEEMGIHGSHCGCENCDSDGICLKTWSTTEDNFGHINKLKIKGPDGVCEKKVVREEGQYALYVRADLPGLEPDLEVMIIEDRCILAFGKPQPRERYMQGARNYLVFVQLRCSCCKFDNLYQDYEDGVLRLFCKIIAPEPDPSSDLSVSQLSL